MPKPSPTQIKSWVSKHFEFKEKVGKYGPELRICNPYDYPRDHKFLVYINLSKAAVNDFRPNHKRHVSGTFLNFVKHYRKISFNAAVKEVMGSYARSDPRLEDYSEFQRTEKSVVRVELPEGFVKLSESNDVFGGPVRNYLNDRQITDDQIEVFGMGHNGLDAVFPYHEFGDVVYWQSRSTVNKTFMFPAESSKTEFVYGFDNLDLQECEANGKSYDVKIFNSGPGYSDQEEIEWDEITRISGSPEQIMEMTSVTKLPRRAFTFSKQNLWSAIKHNDTGHKTFICVNFMNYVDYAVTGKRTEADATKKVKDWLNNNLWDICDASGAIILCLGTGALTDDMITLI